MSLVNLVRRRAGRPYGPSQGVVLPIVAILGCAVGMVIVLANSPSPRDLPLLIGLLLIGWIVHLVMIRPRIFLSDELLILQGAVLDREIPISSVTRVLIGNYTKISTTQGSYTSAAISRRLRGREARGWSRGNELSQADLFEADLNALLQRESSRPLVEKGILNRWAWPELGILLGLGLSVALSVFFRVFLG